MTSILLVEDEFLVARLLQRNLGLLGYDIVELVSTGEEAVVRAKQSKPDFVVMDIRLVGNLDGIQAAKEIRKVCDCEIIFLSGYSDPETKALAMETEPLAFLVKPISPEKIQAVIEEHVRKNSTKIH